jgi:hypothetical protein
VRLARISVVAIAMALVTCTSGGRAGEPGAPATSPPLTGSAVDETPGPVTMAQAKACPVTLPRPAGPSGPARDAFFGGEPPTTTGRSGSEDSGRTGLSPPAAASSTIEGASG